MRVLITGSEGYIGSRLCPSLAEAGFAVAGLDTGFFRDEHFAVCSPPSVRLLQRDTRDVQTRDLGNCEALIHMAELSNDPLGEIDPALTNAINFQASARLAGLAREAGIRRFVYFSSCSVYGKGADELCTERSETRPQTPYAHAKRLSEAAILKLRSSDFAPVILRNATVFGPSPRMRLDLVLNNLAALAWVDKEVRMVSDGSPHRPLIHVQDLCRAVRLVLDAPAEEVSGEIFNCGDTALNYRVLEIAAAVREVFPGCQITSGGPSPDNRSYRVSFDKIRQRLGFEATRTALDGAEELRRLYERLPLTRGHLAGPMFFRCQRVRQLLHDGLLDRELRWTRLSRGHTRAPAASAG